VKYLSLHADNGDVTWLRYPIDALLFYRMQSFAWRRLDLRDRPQPEWQRSGVEHRREARRRGGLVLQGTTCWSG